MSKEEPGRLLSKMAKFVRNPMKDWADLDAQDATAGESGYSREMLKEMIERRQRNDSVRRREFDTLRRLRQRGGIGGVDSEQMSSLGTGVSSDRNDGRALTLRKIDEIEAQMSKQWWKGDPKAVGGAEVHPEVLAAQRARAYADTTPGIRPDHDLAIPPAPGSVDAAARSSSSGPELLPVPVYDNALDEAALRFANGDEAEAEAVLLRVLANDGALADHTDTWLALLDLYRALGEADKFAVASARYAQRLRRKEPQWISLRELALEVLASAATADEASITADWRSPPRLGRADLARLTRDLSAAGPSWTLDWRALTAIDADAAGPLRVLFTHWADSPVDLRFVGARRLEAVLARATPIGDRGTAEFWWQLRMAALRVTHSMDPFELAALHYCITFETPPPAWVEPRGRYASIDTDTNGKNASEPEGSAGDAPLPLRHDAGRPMLSGELGGESRAVWQRLDAELAHMDNAAPFPRSAPLISCAALVRMDLVAAAAMLDWVTTHEAQGRRVQLVEVNRLVAALFRVVGIADHAVVNLRPN